MANSCKHLFGITLAAFYFCNSAVGQGPTFLTSGLVPIPVDLGYAVADIDGDGDQDIVANSLGSRNLGVFLKNGAGEYESNIAASQAAGPLNCAELVLADLFGSALPEVICSDQDSAIHILPNVLGTFLSPITVVPGQGPGNGSIRTAVADFNRDGLADLIFQDPATFELRILSNLGGGSFQQISAFDPSTLPPLNMPLGIESLGDFNGDGAVDVLSVSFSGVVVMTRNPSQNRRAFRIALQYPLPLASSYKARFGDIDGDGDLDLAITTHTNGQFRELHFARNTGGVLQAVGAPILLSASLITYAPSLEITDLNGDGKLDIIVADTDNLQRVFIQGAQAFSFTDASTQFLGPLATLPITTHKIVNLDSDGIADVIGLSPYGDGYVATNLRGTGLRDLSRFQAPSTAGVFLDRSEIPTLHQVCHGDFNGDGFNDLVAPYVNHLVLWLGDGTGRFGSVPRDISSITIPALLARSYSCAAGDLNQDGIADLVLGQETSGGGVDTVLYGDTTGNFLGAGQQIAPTSQNYYTQRIVIAEMNGDGRPDIVMAGEVNSTQFYQSVRVLLTNNTQTFQEVILPLADRNWTTLAVGDINNDGLNDIYVGTHYTFVPTLNLQASFINNGNGLFTSGSTVGMYGISDMEFLDVNRDGVTDFIQTSSMAPSILYVGVTAGGFLAVPFPDTFGATGAVVTDFDDDGWVDIVLHDSSGNLPAGPSREPIRVYRNSGSAFVAMPMPFQTNDTVFELAAANLDGDRFPDLLALSAGSRTYPEVLLDGAFTSSFSSMAQAGRQLTIRHAVANATPGAIVHLFGNLAPLASGVQTSFGLLRLTAPAYLSAAALASGTVSQSFPIPAIPGLGQLSVQAILQDGANFTLLPAQAITIE